MKNLFGVIAVALCALALPAHAANSECDAQATEKKLAGAAKTSFVNKCVADAKTAKAETAKSACDGQAADKKLAGAARTSFVKKCVADAIK